MKARLFIYLIIQTIQYYFFIKFFSIIYESSIKFWEKNVLNSVGLEFELGAGLGIGLAWMLLLFLLSLFGSILIFIILNKIPIKEVLKSNNDNL